MKRVPQAPDLPFQMNQPLRALVGLAILGLAGPTAGTCQAGDVAWQAGPGGRWAELPVPKTGKTGFSLIAAEQTGVTFTNSLEERAGAANRVLYKDGVPVAALESGETRFLVEMSRAMEWKAKSALLRKATPPALRSYLRRPA